MIIKKNINELIIISLFLILFITFKIIFGQNDGYIASDSKLYFLGAENFIKNGTLFFKNELIFNNFAIPNLQGNGYLFAIQPPLYILLISTISKITTIDIFWSSKIINYLCIIGIYYFLRFHLFKSKLLSIFVLLNSSFLEVFSYSLIEPLFLFLLIGNIVYLNKFCVNLNNNLFFILAVILFSFFLSFSRYNGMLILPCLLTVSLYMLYLNKINKAIILIAISFLLIVFIFLWLNFVYQNTGLLTGFSRGIRDDAFYYFLYCFRSIIIESNYLISSTWNLFNIPRDDLHKKFIIFIIFYFIQFMPIIFFYKKFNFKTKDFYPNSKNISFNVVIFIFLICFSIPIFLVHIFTMIDPINFRTISPISLMIIILVIVNLKSNFYGTIKQSIKNYFLYLIILSILTNILSQFYFIGYNLV